MTQRSKRQKAYRSGIWAEWVAIVFFKLRFYRILHQRFKSPMGEIDLIAKRGRSIVFVEVKFRRSLADEAAALEAVNRRRIVRAAHYFIAHNPQFAMYPQRFDIIFLAPWAMPRHMSGAFDGE